MNKFIIAILLLCGDTAQGQTTSLDALLDGLSANPQLRMYDYEIRSMDEAAKGARSWMPPQVGAGLWMAPYNPGMWKPQSDGMSGMETPGMGQFMVSVEQMFPQAGKLNADYAYMSAMSSVEGASRAAALNTLVAEVKKNYYQWLVIKRKQRILSENEKLLDYMIKSAELRYKNGLEKINAYYKAKASLGNVQQMQTMLVAEANRRRILINSLLYRDRNTPLEIDTAYTLRDNSSYIIDTSRLAAQRSDIAAVDRQIQLNTLRTSAERARLKPEFGIRYDHMMGLSRQPAQFTLMGMMRIPIAPWSSRMSKANIASYQWRGQALQQQRQMLLNEATGMAYGMLTEIEAKRKQVALYEDKIIPALRNNYRTFLLAYEQNTEELFMLFDAWETLNMTQLEYLDRMQELFTAQTELERILEIR